MRGGLFVEREELRFIARRLHDGQPVRGEAVLVEIAEVEEELQVHVHDARNVFGALDVAGHPVERVGDAA